MQARPTFSVVSVLLALLSQCAFVQGECTSCCPGETKMYACVNSYEELKCSLFDTPGNLPRIINTFFPPSDLSPDVVDVFYILSGTDDATMIGNGSLECSDTQDDALVQESNYTYMWTNNKLFLSLDPAFFELSTVWIFQLQRSCVQLTIKPFCDISNISESTRIQFLAILTSWVRIRRKIQYPVRLHVVFAIPIADFEYYSNTNKTIFHEFI